MAKRYQEGSKEKDFGDQPKKIMLGNMDQQYYSKGNWDGSMDYDEQKMRAASRDAAKLRKGAYKD